LSWSPLPPPLTAPPAKTALQLCNHPRLLLSADSDVAGAATASGQSGAAAAGAAALQAALGAGGRLAGGGAAEGAGRVALELPGVEASGKLACLAALLGSVLGSGARAVVVSTSTATLDLVDAMLCQPNGWVRVGGLGVRGLPRRLNQTVRMGAGCLHMRSDPTCCTGPLRPPPLSQVGNRAH
jgi:hypothetical protein